MASLRLLIVGGAVLIAAILWLTISGSTRLPRPKPLPVLHEVGDFVVTNQLGNPVRAADLRGRPWAIDLIFTRCPGPCTQLTRALHRIQQALPANSRAGLLSVTSDPEFDQPPVLREYARKFGVDSNRWQFVTAGKSEIRQLATRQLLLVLLDKPAAERTSEEDLFLHSTLIVLMDGQGRLRATVEGLDPGAPERVVEILRQLEAEEGEGRSR